MRPPKSFTQVEGWRESFAAAAKKQELIRASSLFPEVPVTLCGEEVRALTLADWTLLSTMARSPFFVGGFPEAKHASNVIWLLRRRWLSVGHGWLSRVLRRWQLWTLLARYGFNEKRIVDEVSAFIDDAFIDMPGAFAPDDGKKNGLNPTRMPHVTAEISFCGEVMEQFPSFRYGDLRRMALPQFWQWLHEARTANDPEYHNPQMTDLVNRNANAELNRLRREEREQSAA
jgi:hypothetical protein